MARQLRQPRQPTRMKQWADRHENRHALVYAANFFAPYALTAVDLPELGTLFPKWGAAVALGAHFIQHGTIKARIALGLVGAVNILYGGKLAIDAITGQNYYDLIEPALRGYMAYHAIHDACD